MREQLLLIAVADAKTMGNWMIWVALGWATKALLNKRVGLKNDSYLNKISVLQTIECEFTKSKISKKIQISFF